MITEMRLFFLTILFLAGGMLASAQEPGFYLGPRLSLGQSHFYGMQGFQDGIALQIGVSSSKQITQQVAVEFMPYVGLYNGQRLNGEGDGAYANGTRKLLWYHDKYNIYSVEFPLYAKFSGGFRSVNFGFFFGPSLGYLMGGTRSKQYEDPGYNSDHGYGGHPMEDLKRGMYSGDFGVSAELTASRGIVAIDFRFHHNFSPLGSLDNQYFTADSKTIGVAWLFNAK